jgi:hypothetical protein
MLSIINPARHAVIRKRVERRSRSIPAGFAYLAAANGTFFRTVLILLVVAVALIVWGLGLVHFDLRDDIRGLIHNSSLR